MLTSLFKGSTQQVTRSPQTPALSFSSNAPSWDALEEIVRAKQTELGVDFWSIPEDGPTNPLALKRTFGKEGPIRVKLYRDHAAWCPYCQKVWLQLEEKQIPYIMEKINMRCYGDKPKSFLSKVPSGLLPVMEIDGRVVTESVYIMNLLEELFPDRPLMPPKGTAERARADQLMRLERQFFSDWLSWLCYSYNARSGRKQFENTLEEICRELEINEGPFFLGNDISLVDITFTPMLERAAASLAYYKGFYMRGQGRYPALERWFAAMETRSTYLGTKSDYYTHCHDLPPQLGGCVMTEEGQPVAEVIDGEAPGSWRLPLPPLTATSLPEPYSPGEDPNRDKLEAAARLVGNHEAVVRFALRGPGKPGPQPVSAPLADPSAIAAMQYHEEVDQALRHVAHALLVGVEAKQVSKEALQVSSAASGCSGDQVMLAAEYLRDRVGVPRDMKYPAARQLRAHLNWMIDSLQPAAP